MKPSIVVYIPVFNSCEWASSVELPPGSDYIVFDNQSTDGTAEIFAKRGVKVIVAEGRNGRLDNWRACMMHFAQSGSEWMRWLFAGDTIKEGSSDYIREQLLTFPDTKILVGAFRNDLGEPKPQLVRAVDEARWISPVQACRRAASEGNWFGPPLTVCMHRDVVLSGKFQFGEFEWAADYYAAVSSTAELGCLAVPGEFGTFCGAHRKFFQTKKNSSQARIETQAVRFFAARRLLQLGGLQEEHDNLLAKIEKDAWKECFQNLITLQRDPEYLQELAARTPVRLLLRMLPARLLALLRKVTRRGRNRL